jgi:hypothetical protein
MPRLAALRHRVERRDGFLVRQAVFGGNRYCTIAGISLGRVVDPFGRSGHPAATVKEHDCGTRGSIACLRPEDVCGQVGGSDSFIDFDFGTGTLRVRQNCCRREEK